MLIYVIVCGVHKCFIQYWVCACFVIGDSGGNAVDMCGVVSLILWCPNMGLVGEWYMLLCVRLVVVMKNLIGSVGLARALTHHQYGHFST